MLETIVSESCFFNPVLAGGGKGAEEVFSTGLVVEVVAAGFEGSLLGLAYLRPSHSKLPLAAAYVFLKSAALSLPLAYTL